MLERFVVKCYKVILGIHEDVRIEEVKLVKILNVDTLKEMWRKRRMRAISHIARLPYDNPARITMFGHPIIRKKCKERKFENVKSTTMKTIKKVLNEEEFCNLCDRNIRE